jgi:hypothetical protein
VKPCSSCALHRPDWQGKTYEHGVCIWFLKKLKMPQPIPANVAATGCANWRSKDTLIKTQQES